ncbi:MAG: SufD family Fe-S cluster assembly protein [Candidatus Thermoplasmatota archaeon]|nr:SufD family Fe-S cluster assembly protein [Candidatus Thermoplasmatota archaeon]
MDSSSEYLSLEEPNRAVHLWRYTPWRRVHPTGNIGDIPEDISAPKLSLSCIEGEIPEGVRLIHGSGQVEGLPESDATTSSFMRAITEESSWTVEVDAGFNPGKTVVLEIDAGSSISAVHVCLKIGRHANLELVTLVKGDCDWMGLLRTGTSGEGSNTSDVVVNVMDGGTLLRVDAIHIDRDSQVTAGTISSGSEMTKSDLRYRMGEPGGNLNVLGSILSANEMSLDHHIEIHHDAPETYSRLDWHSACGGNSKTVGTGMLRVAEGSRGADAAQLFQNLLISESAQADSIPELEVSENEVVGCGHGTASGPVDEDQLFYLGTRGLSSEQAKSVLIAAFLNSTLTEMGSQEMHDWLVEMLSDDLDALGI